jgi:endoglucanase
MRNKLLITLLLCLFAAIIIFSLRGFATFEYVKHIQNSGKTEVSTDIVTYEYTDQDGKRRVFAFDNSWKDKTYEMFALSNDRAVSLVQKNGNAFYSATLPAGNNGVTFIATRGDEITKKAIDISQKTTRASGPFFGAKFYVPDHGEMDRLIQNGEAPEISEIRNQPRAVWLGAGENTAEEIKEVMKEANVSQATPVFVIYYASLFPCGKKTTSEWNEMTKDYFAWLLEFRRNIGGGTAIVILEPDALSYKSCIYEDPAETNIIGRAVSILKNKDANLHVYIDAGHSGWVPAKEMSERLVSAHIGEANGISLNVSNFTRTEDNIVYGMEISSFIGKTPFVIDTSRNGNGPDENNEWCNPRRRALGENPTGNTGHELADAYLWIKIPGESDGDCNGGPEEGIFWKDYALELIRNR